MLPTTVRSYKSTDYGAPVLRGVAGDLIAVLDACLVDGYGQRSVQSITRSGTTATATIAGHLHNEHDVLTIAGADQTEYNGTHRIFNVTTDTFDFEVSGAPATPATGTITAKKPGGGWGKAFTGTNKAAYRSADVQSTRLFLRIDDSTTTYATVTGYEFMDSIDVGGGLFPIATAPLYWLKSSTADTTARAWELVTDGALAYLFVAHHATNSNGHTLSAFGDINSARQGDAFRCLIIGASSNAVAQPGQNSQGPLACAYYGAPTYASTQMMARGHTQTGAAVDVQKLAVGFNGINLAIGWGQTQTLAYPHAVDNGLVAVPALLAESTALIRGAMPGYYIPLHTLPGTRLTVIGDWPALPGRKIWLIPQGTGNSNNSYEGRACIDITGPWR